MSNTETNKTATTAKTEAPKSKQTLQTYIAACVAIFIFGMEYIVLGSILPIFKETMSAGQITLLATLLPIGVLVGSMLFGPFQDNHGYRRVLIAFTALGMLGLAILANAKAYSIIAASVVLVGISSGALNGSASAIMSDISTERNRATNLVVLGLVYCIGALCTPMAIKAMIKSIGYQWPILIVAILMMLTIVLYLLVKFPKHEASRKVTGKDIAALLKEPFLWIFSMSGFSISTTACFIRFPQTSTPCLFRCSPQTCVITFSSLSSTTYLQCKSEPMHSSIPNIMSPDTTLPSECSTTSAKRNSEERRLMSTLLSICSGRRLAYM